VLVIQRIAASLLLLLTGQVIAHHAEAEYDRTRTLSVSGTVKAFLWANPHTLILLEVTDSSGRTDVDVFEGGSVIVMRRTGWARDSLKVGDKVAITFHPRRDNKRGGMFLTASGTDGRVLGWRPATDP
jgi:Family of unknown function (DUF6152)